MCFRVLCVAVFACFLSLGFAASADASVGVVVDVKGSASLIRKGRTASLVSGAVIDKGDVVKTAASGQVQLVFDDKTKIAVGPNSSLSIDNILMRSETRASKFAVSSVSGTFRFISGKSKKSAYEINTPTATLGIRGTAFDFAVGPDQKTSLALYRGRVVMCGRGSKCAEVRGRCTLFQANRRGDLGSPNKLVDAQGIIDNNFPYLTNQTALRPSFRTNVDNCDDKHGRAPIEHKADTPEAKPAPPPAPPPVKFDPDPWVPPT